MDPQTTQIARSILREAPSGLYSTRPVEPVREFDTEGSYGVSASLQDCLQSGYQPLFMPELALVRSRSAKDARPWQVWYVTPSMRATGQTKAGSKVVVYAHVPNYFSEPANIKNVIESGKLKNYAGEIPQADFDKLVDLNGNGRVFVVDYDTLRKSPSEVIHVDDALEHPQTIPFLGGEAIAQAYLAKHKEVYGNRIGVWHFDDFDKKTPHGRVLFLGDDIYGLGGGSGIGIKGRVLGVAPEARSVEKNRVFNRTNSDFFRDLPKFSRLDDLRSIVINEGDVKLIDGLPKMGSGNLYYRTVKVGEIVGIAFYGLKDDPCGGTDQWFSFYNFYPLNEI